jgi:GxxExxY protein
MADLVYPKESYYLTGIFYSIQNQLGSTGKEKQYADAIEIVFKNSKDDYEREKEIILPFIGGEIGGNRVDFIFRKIILIDAKAKSYITREDYRQMIRYLEASKLKLGIIVNFRGSKIQIKRVINLK